jgi:hypothetical protein
MPLVMGELLSGNYLETELLSFCEDLVFFRTSCH